MKTPPYIPVQERGSSLWFYADHAGKKSPGYHSKFAALTAASTAEVMSERRKQPDGMLKPEPRAVAR